jgi:cytochrome c2
MEFLEIDFYDWTRENLRQYFRDRKKWLPGTKIQFLFTGI